MTLDPFYVADKELYEAAHNIVNLGMSLTKLLLGDSEQGFAPAGIRGSGIMMPYQPATCLWILCLDGHMHAWQLWGHSN